MKMNAFRLVENVSKTSRKRFVFPLSILGLTALWALGSESVFSRTGESSPNQEVPASMILFSPSDADHPSEEETGRNGFGDFVLAQNAPDSLDGPGLQGAEDRNDAEPPGPPNRRRPRDRERTVPLPEAIDGAEPTDPIKLNQRDIFITADQVQLRGVYYKGSADNSTIPVILIHDKKGKKEDMEPLAKKLAEKGMAVLLPDLRGHGESVTAAIEDFSPGGDRPAIRQNEYRAESFNESDLEGMRSYDGLLWFQFLVWLHNEEKINLRRLVIVGNGFGAGIGASWILNDWKATPKKGRFTKGLVLISPDPDSAFEEIGSSRAKPNSVRYKIFVGHLEKTKFQNSETIRLEIAKEKDSTPEEERKVPIESFKTEKQGIQLLDVESFQIPDKIIQFIEEINSSSSAAKWQPIKHFMENR